MESLIATVLSVLVFTFGLSVGSFLNVVVLRWNTGKISGPDSVCFSCRASLKWTEMVPIGSYLIQLGRCRHCNSKISAQYPIVEFLTGLTFILIYLKFGLSVLSLIYAIAWALLIVIAVYDFYHKIIPDELVYIFIIISLVSLMITGFLAKDISVGPILFLFFGFLWLISSGRWMGLGDAKLSLGVGWLLGFNLGISAIFISFWVGALFGIFWLLASGSYATIKHEIPFAPFIVIATWLVFFWQIDIINFLLNGYWF